jgi:hypothetical protein
LDAMDAFSSPSIGMLITAFILLMTGLPSKKITRFPRQGVRLDWHKFHFAKFLWKNLNWRKPDLPTPLFCCRQLLRQLCIFCRKPEMNQ